MTNIYLSGSLPKLFAKTAAPIILVMVVNGLFNVVDAYFLGIFVSSEALTAVTMMFPLQIFLIAVVTVISSGFSSVLSRLLGAKKYDQANTAFTNAHLLSVVVCFAVILLFMALGNDSILLVTGGNPNLSDMGYTYISIIVFSSPLMFFLSIHSDALRCEGNLKLMTLVSLLSTLLNIVFNYILIVWLEWSVAGSAYGTVLAQLVSILVILQYRFSTRSTYVPEFNGFKGLWQSALEVLPLGAPVSLGYVGLSLMTASALYNVQIWGGDTAAATAGAYGIIIRILTFCYMPLLGLTVAFQTIAGNNFGANQMERVDTSLRLALLCSFIFCSIAQIVFIVFANDIGSLFVDDAAMVAETARILPIMTMLYFWAGPSMMLSGFFQAIGDAARAAILNIPRTFAFLLPLMYLLPYHFGEVGIWYAGPITDILMLLLTASVLTLNQRSAGKRLGLFQSA